MRRISMLQMGDGRYRWVDEMVLYGHEKALGDTFAFTWAFIGNLMLIYRSTRANDSDFDCSIADREEVTQICKGWERV